MDHGKFKLAGRFLKKAYEELDIEAVKHSVPLDSKEYKEVQAKIRGELLKRIGVSEEDYKKTKEEVINKQKEKRRML